MIAELKRFVIGRPLKSEGLKRAYAVLIAVDSRHRVRVISV
ncbi:hypothetical protein [Paenibacillus sp.]|nr:hypothetical protein [Paenibacillus sp.]